MSKFTLPMAMAVPLAVTAINLGKDLMAGNEEGVMEKLTGYNVNTGKVTAYWPIRTYGPLVMGYAMHKIASSVGFNKALGQMKIPLIRV
jgi:hypothetical protein